MIRKLWIPIVAMAMLLSACGAGSDDDQAADGSIRVHIWSNFVPDIPRGKVLDELIATFNKEHKGEIEVVSDPEPDWLTLQQKIRSSISAGDAPDVFLYNFNPNDMSRESSGQLMDLTPYMDADPEWKARFKPEQLEAIQSDGNLGGIPSDQSPVLFYYHKDLFEKAGITEFPKTWDEFTAAADKLKASGVAPIALFTGDDAWYTMNAFSYYAMSVGGPDSWLPGTDLDSDAVVEGARFTQKLFEDYTTPDAVGSNYSVAVQNFLSKKAAMVVDGPWLIGPIQEQVDSPCDVGVAVAPTLGDGTVEPGTNLTDSINTWGVGKQDSQEKADAVVEWLKFMTSQENAVKFSIEGQYPQALNTEFSDEDLAKTSCQMASVLKIQADAPASVVQLQRSITAPAQEKVNGMLEQLALGDMTPEEFASQLQAANQP
jgi:ABC-type glycerol-3-phosphate transport system substrate-binding protein